MVERLGVITTVPIALVAYNGQIQEDDEYVRHLTIDRGGVFEVKQTAIYLQDAWGITDNINLSLGIRNETFDNRNATGETFIKGHQPVGAAPGYYLGSVRAGYRSCLWFYRTVLYAHCCQYQYPHGWF